MPNSVATLAVIIAVVALISIWLSSRARTFGSFYRGHDENGRPPGTLTLTFSLVTTWIFARSILNAAILGYAFGIAGALAYTAYYLSFLTGASIIASLRFRCGFGSIQEFLGARFGVAGTSTYNFVIGVRLLSEVFANLLVIGLIFGQDGSSAYASTIALVGVVTLGYSLLGGLNASIQTDVFQMAVFLITLGLLMVLTLTGGTFDIEAMALSSPGATNPGWVLLAVALLQVWSYPMHDPVMMDRGFIADRHTTMASFYHAAWVSIPCILAFGLLGVWAGLARAEGEDFVSTLTRLTGDGAMLLFNLALVVSCMSTIDSTYSSAAKLAVLDMRLAKPTLANGRITMALFLLGGLALVFLGSKDLFDAVAVSGTASMFLAPVVFFSLWGGFERVPVWSYLTSFFTAMAAAGLYFTESSGYTNAVASLSGLQDKYSILLLLSVVALAVGCGAFATGIALAESRGGVRAAGEAGAGQKKRPG